MYKVYINAGHGNAQVYNSDQGAVNPRLGLRENQLAAKVAEMVVPYLQKVGYTVRSWQDDALGAIARDVNNWGADVCVSIHCNSVADPNPQGVETLVYPGYAEDLRLAKCVQAQVVESVTFPDRGVKFRTDLGILSIPRCPAILVEMGFISNDVEGLFIDTEADVYARAIARGITDYVAGVSP